MRRIRHKPSLCAIHKQIQLLKHRLTNQDFITEDKSFFCCVSAVNVEDYGFGNVNGLIAPIGVFDYPLTANRKAQLLHDMRWQHTANCPCVNHGISFILTNLL